jgi:CheY-like chemotaxis protein
MLDAQAAMHLALVLHELGTNARKHGSLSTPKGRLSVSWTMRANGGRALLLRWRETGGPKVKAPSSSGFGTSLIERTVQVHGGDASLQYGADGVTCEIRLPLAQEPAHIPLLPETRPARPRSGAAPVSDGADQLALSGRRILVVEDEPLVSMDIEAVLSEAGCEMVQPASDLARAKALATDGGWDAALVDANLAGQSVDELAAALKQRDIPFAFVTGYGRDSLPPTFREAKLLAKPFGREQLLALVGQLLQPGARVIPLRPNRM